MRRFLFSFVFMLLAGLPPTSHAQTYWSNPEAEQLYKQGRDYLNKGSFALAVNAFQQAAARAPEQKFIYRDLAQAYYFGGNYEQAYKTILPQIESGNADVESYQIAAASLTARKEIKKARKILSDGLAKYPSSGMLYFEYGRMYDDNGEPEAALKQWLLGIEADPGYRVNYYEAAKAYAKSKEPYWALLYAEIFVNMERVTPRSADARKLLLETYKKVFLGNRDGSIGTLKTGNDNSFEQAVSKTWQAVAPVVIDGITTENLIMLRARFVAEWSRNYSSRYPYSLFYYWDAMLRNGHFDAYNQWLFGKAENDKQYQSWQGFHPEAIPGYEAWAAQNPLRPTAADNYNDKKVKDLLPDQKSPYKR